MRHATLLLVLLLLVPLSADGTPEAAPQHVYVSSTVIHNAASRVFSSFAVTNTTRFWFNPDIYLVDRDGQVVHHASPLLKGFGTWHDISGSLLSDDFNGSIWIVSSQPLVVNSYTHQADEDGHVTLLASSEAKAMTASAVEAIVQNLTTPPTR